MTKLFIGVAAHKRYAMPAEKEYMTIQVGSAIHEKIDGYIHDCDGVSISSKNPYYSELTATYYIWKNIKADYKGLVHYRRYFGKKIRKSTTPFDGILNEQNYKEIFLTYDVIVPKKRNYFIESNYSHYGHAHNINDLNLLVDLISKENIEYGNAFRKVLKRRSAHMFNMYVMKADLFDDYCAWMFPILEKLESIIDLSEYTIQEQRVFGYLSELMLDAWLDVKKPKYFEAPVLYIEGQQIIKKVFGFLYRKFIGHAETHISSKIDAK